MPFFENTERRDADANKNIKLHSAHDLHRNGPVANKRNTSRSQPNKLGIIAGQSDTFQNKNCIHKTHVTTPM